MLIENSVTRVNCSAPLGKPSDAKQLPSYEIFNLHLTTIEDSYILAYPTRFSTIFTGSGYFFLTWGSVRLLGAILLFIPYL